MYKDLENKYESEVGKEASNDRDSCSKIKDYFNKNKCEFIQLLNEIIMIYKTIPINTGIKKIKSENIEVNFNHSELQKN